MPVIGSREITFPYYFGIGNDNGKKWVTVSPEPLNGYQISSFRENLPIFNI